MCFGESCVVSKEQLSYFGVLCVCVLCVGWGNLSQQGTGTVGAGGPDNPPPPPFLFSPCYSTSNHHVVPSSFGIPIPLPMEKKIGNRHSRCFRCFCVEGDGKPAERKVLYWVRAC